MATFPRTIMPSFASVPSVPTGLVSLGQTGKVQLRNTLAMGREWTERWDLLSAGDPNVEKLIAFIEHAYHTQQIFDVVHPTLPGCGMPPNGAGGGTPLVNGAGQTGDEIATDGWTANVSNIVRAGDCIRIGGLNMLFRILEDASSNSSGQVNLKISPLIPVGSSPSDNAPITRTDNLMRAYIAERPNMPQTATRSGMYYGGLQVTFREAL